MKLQSIFVHVLSFSIYLALLSAAGEIWHGVPGRLQYFVQLQNKLFSLF